MGFYAVFVCRTISLHNFFYVNFLTEICELSHGDDFAETPDSDNAQLYTTRNLCGEHLEGRPFMKRNILARIAAVLTIVTIASACGLSSTLAKYTTGVTAREAARTAKFGVLLSVSGNSAFASEYKVEDPSVAAVASGMKFSVKSKDDAKVVAPGTCSDDISGSLLYSISGKPEVAVRLDVSFTGVKEIFVAKGTVIPDYTKAPKQVEIDVEGTPTLVNVYGTYEVEEDYYPVVFDLSQISDASGIYAEPVVLAAGTLDELKSFLADYSQDADYGPGTDLNSSFKIGWYWTYGEHFDYTDYKQSGIPANDIIDSFLGAVAANNSLTTYYYAETTNVGGTDVTEYRQATVDADAYSLDISYTVNVKVTQID